MKKLLTNILLSTLFLASCNEYDDIYYYDMFIALEVVDPAGNDLLQESSGLIHYGETNVKIGEKYYYLNSQDTNSFTFRCIENEAKNYLKIGCWYYDRTDLYLIIDWGGDMTKDVLVFSYDSPLDGLDSPSHDFRYPYSITINGKDLEFNKETGHFIYIKEM